MKILELKNTITGINNSLDGLNGKLEERFGELEVRLILIQSKQQKQLKKH